MMEHDKLTGIERELVLQYLIDGNVPVTLTPVEEELTSLFPGRRIARLDGDTPDTEEAARRLVTLFTGRRAT